MSRKSTETGNINYSSFSDLVNCVNVKFAGSINVRCLDVKV